MAAVRVTPRLGVHLRHERAHGVDDAKPAPLAVVAHRRRHAVRGEHADLAGGHVILRVDEDRAHAFEALHNMVVVDDLMAHVDRRPMLGEQALDDLDRPVDTRAERPRCSEEHALAHVTASRLFNARRAFATACAVSSGERAKPRTKPRTSGSPFAFTASPRPASLLVGVSLIARMQPASLPLRASVPDSMSTASAPVCSCSRARSDGSSTIRPEPRIVPARADVTPSRPPSQSTDPSSSTTRVASITVPTGRSPRRAPAIPNETSRSTSGTPFEAPSPTRTVGPSRRAARSSTLIAQAKVSPTASTPCSSRLP